jgi:hypothetical protein
VKKILYISAALSVILAAGAAIIGHQKKSRIFGGQMRWK